PQRLVDVEALDQGVGGGNAQHRLGDEGPRESAAVRGRAAGASGRPGNKGFEADHVEGRDEPPERFSHRVDFLAKPRKQIALDVVPARFHRVERIVGHACYCESGRWNQNNISTSAKDKAYYFTVHHLKCAGRELNILPRQVRTSK